LGNESTLATPASEIAVEGEEHLAHSAFADDAFDQVLSLFLTFVERERAARREASKLNTRLEAQECAYVREDARRVARIGRRALRVFRVFGRRGKLIAHEFQYDASTRKRKSVFPLR